MDGKQGESMGVLLSVDCPRCGIRLELPSSAMGKRLRCGSCREIFRHAPGEASSEAAVAAEAPSGDEPLPERFGSYRVERLLGQGGMGAVYLARDERLDRPVAIKVLARHLARDREFLLRFKREARALANLEHENVTGIYFLEDQGTPYFAMEYVEGLSLERILREQGQLAVKDALHIAVQTARALEAADRQRIVHRDVKPANLLIRSRDGVVKVTDFGLAKALEGASSLTSVSVVLGTPHYMSPEQGRGDSDLDGRSDQYGLGATLWHMLCGRPPFEGHSPTDVVMKHVHEALPSLSALCPEASVELTAVIERMLAKDRNRRFPDFPSLVRALEAVRVGPRPRSDSPVDTASEIGPTQAIDFAEIPSSPRTPVEGAIPRPSSFRRWLAVFFLGTLLAFLAGAVTHGPDLRQPLVSEEGVAFDFARDDCPVDLLRVEGRRVRWLPKEGSLRFEPGADPAVALFALPLGAAFRLNLDLGGDSGEGVELGVTDLVDGAELRLEGGRHRIMVAPMPGLVDRRGERRGLPRPLDLLRHRVPRWLSRPTRPFPSILRDLVVSPEGEGRIWVLDCSPGKARGALLRYSVDGRCGEFFLPAALLASAERYMWIRVHRPRPFDLRFLDLRTTRPSAPAPLRPLDEEALMAFHAYLRRPM